MDTKRQIDIFLGLICLSFIVIAVYLLAQDTAAFFEHSGKNPKDAALLAIALALVVPVLSGLPKMKNGMTIFWNGLRIMAIIGTIGANVWFASYLSIKPMIEPSITDVQKQEIAAYERQIEEYAGTVALYEQQKAEMPEDWHTKKAGLTAKQGKIRDKQAKIREKIAMIIGKTGKNQQDFTGSFSDTTVFALIIVRLILEIAIVILSGHIRDKFSGNMQTVNTEKPIQTEKSTDTKASATDKMEKPTQKADEKTVEIAVVREKMSKWLKRKKSVTWRQVLSRNLAPAGVSEKILSDMENDGLIKIESAPTKDYTEFRIVGGVA